MAAGTIASSSIAITCRRPLSSSTLQRSRPPPQLLVRGLSSSSTGSSSFGKGGGGELEPAERDIKQPSMDVEKDVAVALRGVQELHRAGKYKEVSLTVWQCVWRAYVYRFECLGRSIDLSARRLTR